MTSKNSIDKKALFITALSVARQEQAEIGAPLAPLPVGEYYFANHLRRPTTNRKYMFRFDFAWPEQKIAVEIDGGNYMVKRRADGTLMAIGHHTAPSDYEKINLSQELGWTVFRYTVEMIKKRPELCAAQVIRAINSKRRIT
jgi:very-short-patch-repair endonuclease